MVKAPVFLALSLALISQGSAALQTYYVAVEHRGFNDNGKNYLEALPLNLCQVILASSSGTDCKAKDPKDSLPHYPLIKIGAVPKDGEFNLFISAYPGPDSLSFSDNVLVDKAKMEDFSQALFDKIVHQKPFTAEEKKNYKSSHAFSFEFVPRVSAGFGYFHGYRGKFNIDDYTVRERNGFTRYTQPQGTQPDLDTTLQEHEAPSASLRALLELVYPAYVIRLGINAILPTAISFTTGASFNKRVFDKHEIYAGADVGYTIIAPGTYEDKYMGEANEIPHANQKNGYTVTPFAGIGLFQDAVASIFLEGGFLADLAVDNHSYGNYVTLGMRLKI